MDHGQYLDGLCDDRALLGRGEIRIFYAAKHPPVSISQDECGCPREVLLAGRGRRAFSRRGACGCTLQNIARRFDTSDYIPNRLLCKKFSECPKILRYSRYIDLGKVMLQVDSFDVLHCVMALSVGAQQNIS